MNPAHSLSMSPFDPTNGKKQRDSNKDEYVEIIPFTHTVEDGIFGKRWDVPKK